MNFRTSFCNVEMLQSWKNNLKYFANFPKIIIFVCCNYFVQGQSDHCPSLRVKISPISWTEQIIWLIQIFDVQIFKIISICRSNCDVKKVMLST